MHGALPGPKWDVVKHTQLVAKESLGLAEGFATSPQLQ